MPPIMFPTGRSDKRKLKFYAIQSNLFKIKHNLRTSKIFRNVKNRLAKSGGRHQGGYDS